MEEFTQKLRIIYTKLFDEDMEKFTEAFIDYSKFKREKKSQKEFFINRKIVLRRWLLKGIRCTPDFQKSFNNYKISHYQLGTEQLFRIDDFRKVNNIANFEKRLNAYLQQKQRAYINTDYQYIYTFNETKEHIESYHIRGWFKGEDAETIIEVEYKEKRHRGTFAFHDDNNIFITLKVDNITHYLLFHDSNDSGSNYIVGTRMGYLPTDNKVPQAQKIILAKEKLDKDDIELQFILNETESISAIENRFNPNTQEIKISPFVRYHYQFRKYHKLFSRLLSKKFRQSFYYRLAFREFYALKRLFEKVANSDSYFIFNYNRAFFELIKTLEEIKNTKLNIVMEFRDNNIFLESNYKIREVKRRFFNLSTHGIETTLIFIVDSIQEIPLSLKTLLKDMKKYKIDTRLTARETVINDVNSLDFAFIHMNDERDFVFADPLRDSKDVFKLFIDEVTMDEYRIDYGKIFDRSISM
jgi:hypothetical protein